MTDERVEFLGNVSLFSNMGKVDLSNIARSGTELRFSSGDLICSRGDSGKSMFIITSGIVEVFVDSENGHQILSHLHRGDYFGEMSLLSGLPRSASVRSLGETTVFGLTKDSFEDLCRQNVDIALEIIRVLSMRLAARNLQSSSFEKARVFVTLSMEDNVGQSLLAAALAIVLGREDKGQVTLYDPNIDSTCHSRIFHIDKRADLATELVSTGELKVSDHLIKVADNTYILPPQADGGPVVQEFHHHIPFHALCEFSDYLVVDSSSTIAAVNRETIKVAESIVLIVPSGSRDLNELLSQFDRMVLTPAGVDVSKVRIVLANHTPDIEVEIPIDLKRQVSFLPVPPADLVFDEEFFDSDYGASIKQLALGFLDESFVELFIPLVADCDMDYISKSIEIVRKSCPGMVKTRTVDTFPESMGIDFSGCDSFFMVEGVFTAAELKTSMNTLVNSVNELKKELNSEVLFLRIDGKINKL